MRGEGEITGPVRNKPKGGMPGLEGWLTSEDSHSAISFERRDRHLEIMEAPERGLVGNGAHTHKKVLESLAHLKCISTNACSMHKKQGELEAMMHQGNYDIVAITETWWDASHDWSATIDGYKLFRRDRQERRGGGVALYGRECYESLEIKYTDDGVESVWIRLRADKADIAVGVCYRPPNQSSEVDEAFYKQLGEISQSLAVVLVGDFDLPDICWEYNTAEREQSRRLLECVEDNFLTQLEYTSQIRSQITKDFCCMKEYVERQERNTLMFIEQEQKAAQEKTEETIHQLRGEANMLTDIKAQTSDLPERQRYKGSPSAMTKMTLDEKLNVAKTAVEDLKRKLEILLLEYAQQFPPGFFLSRSFQQLSLQLCSAIVFTSKTEDSVGRGVGQELLRTAFKMKPTYCATTPESACNATSRLASGDKCLLITSGICS
ncbi:E3 ubiquitin-protein ligase RNF135 isoform X3 [Chroicocephalus ridibundus]|uniref:E3 ubiquitin-protein ligase RNF135 isoform X3 n=1 Tax=Chroicocephalus ridibundus TaxID=1192867 RepID=UPI002FDCE09B